MAIYDPTIPPLFLTGTITTVVSGQTYPYDDNTGLKEAEAKMDYTITVNNISEQVVGTANIRSGNNKIYNALDIKTGDWVTSVNGQICLQIVRVINKSENQIQFIAKDIDMLSYKTYANNMFSAGDQLAFFEVSDNGQPLITTAGISFFTTSASIDKIQGKFAAFEETERYRFEFSQQQVDIEKGDTVAVDPSTGNFVKFGTPGSTDIPVGMVIEKSMGDRVVYVKPFNTIVDNHSAPETLTGSAGDVYWTDPNLPGKMTTIKSSGAKSLFLQVKDPVATVVECTQTDYLPDVDDSIILNGIDVFNGGVDPTPDNIQDLIDLINLKSDQHFVVADKKSIFASTLTGDGAEPTNGVVIITISDDNGDTWDPLNVTISDGTNTTIVTFDQNQGETLVDLNDLGAPGYLAYTAVELASVLNASFSQDGLDLVADTLPSNTPNYPRLRISTTSDSASINITDGDVDVLGDSFLTGTGLAATTTPNVDDFLVLTRADGGDILITASKGDYINFNGLTSSSLGSPAILLMLEGVGDGINEVGVETDSDLNQTPSVTVEDGDPTGVFISYTPFRDSNVQILINGINVNLGDGLKNQPCYFSADGGVNARLIKDIAAGDQLYWNGSIAGYQLDATDEVDVIYDASSDDV